MHPPASFSEGDLTSVGRPLRLQRSGHRLRVGPAWRLAEGHFHRSLGQRPRTKMANRGGWPKAIFIRRRGVRLVPNVLFVELNAVACQHRPIFVLKCLSVMMFLLVADVMLRLIAVFRTD